MRKTLTLFLQLSFLSGFSQSPIHHITKNYFRAHPFESKFSSFIMNLQNDPLFTVETYNRRTDTTFFYISGIYKNFNPFRYQPAEIRLVLAEEELIHNDSLQTLDTIMNLQLMGITNNGNSSQQQVEKEFRRFHNNESHRFSRHSTVPYEKDNKPIAAIEHYFIFPFSVAPATIAWGPITETNRYTFTITIRFKVKQNIADLIIAPDDVTF